MSLLNEYVYEPTVELVYEPTVELVHEHTNEPCLRFFQAKLFSVQTRFIYEVKFQILFKIISFIIKSSRKRTFTELSFEPLASGLACLHP